MSDDKSWIYLIVMIVLSIIGSINKSKKKNAAPMPAPMEDDDFPTILFPESRKDEPKKTGISESPRVEFQPVSLTSEMENSEGRAFLAQSQEVVEETGQSLELNFSEKYELKKAVIYSEIFGRKFF